MTDFNQICWIASYPKSGNTWVRLLLDAYYLQDVNLQEILCSVGDDGIARYQVGDGSPVQDWPVDIQQLTRPMAMLRTVRAYQATDVSFPLFVKTHNANMITNGIELLPAALTKATIYVVRDPRDVLPSFANHMGVSMEDAVQMMCRKHQLLAAAEHRVADYLGTWADHVSSFVDTCPHNVLLVRYEDLREDTANEFARILRHCGETPDMARVQRAVELTELSKLRKKEAETGFREASHKAKDPFFNKGEVGGWKKKVAPQHAAQLARAFRKVMTKLGYLGKKHGVIHIH